MQSLLSLEERIQNAGRVWGAFKRGFTGGDITDIIDEIVPKDLQNVLASRGISLESQFPEIAKIKEAFETGQKFGELWNTARETFEKLSAKFTEFVVKFEEFVAFMKGEKTGEFDLGIELPKEGPLAEFLSGFDDFGEAFAEINDFLNLDWEGFKQQISDLWKAFLSPWPEIQTFLKESKWRLDDFLESLGIEPLREWDLTWKDVGQAVSNVLAWIANLFIWVVQAIIFGISAIAGFFTFLIAGVVSVYLILGRVFGFIFGLFIKLSGWIGQWVTKTIDRIREWAEELGPKIKEFAENASEDLKEGFTKARDWVTEKVEEIWENITTTFDNIVTDIGTAIENARKAVKDKFEEIKGNVETALDDIAALVDPDFLVQRGIDLIKGLSRGMAGEIEKVITWLTGKIQEVLALFGQIPQSTSPSKITTESGKDVGSGFALGILKSLAEIPMMVTPMMGEIISPDILGTSFNAGDFALANVPAQGVPSMTLIFEADSVRSDEDIETIADRVQNILDGRTRDYASLGYGNSRR
jgi:hypothetical protein